MGRKYEKDQTAQWGEWPREAWFHYGNECFWWHGDCDIYNITMYFFFNSLVFLLFNNSCIFSLKTIEEFRKLMIEIPIPTVKKENSVQKRQAVNVPNFINWRKRGYVTPVRRQVLLCHMPTFLSHRKLGRGMSAWTEQFLWKILFFLCSYTRLINHFQPPLP